MVGYVDDDIATNLLQAVVGRNAVQVRRRKHDASRPEPSCLLKVGPPGHAPVTVLPGRRPLVKPPPIRQAADVGEVWSPTALAPTAGTHEADLAAQLTPVRWIEWSQLGTYRHGYLAL